MDTLQHLPSCTISDRSSISFTSGICSCEIKAGTCTDGGTLCSYRTVQVLLGLDLENHCTSLYKWNLWKRKKAQQTFWQQRGLKAGIADWIKAFQKLLFFFLFWGAIQLFITCNAKIPKILDYLFLCRSLILQLPSVYFYIFVLILHFCCCPVCLSKGPRAFCLDTACSPWVCAFSLCLLP